MNAVKVKKVLYAFVHLVGPLSYLTISTIWGAFFTTKSTFENISDNLGVGVRGVGEGWGEEGERGG